MADTKQSKNDPAEEVAAEVARILERFRQAWQSELPPALEEYLPVEAPLRDRVFIELVRIDLQQRLKAGEPARVEAYLQRFPELANDRQSVIALLVAEYQIRRHRESGHSLKDLEHRFPAYQAELAAYLNSSAYREPDSSTGSFDTLPPSGSGRGQFATLPPQPNTSPVVEGELTQAYCPHEPPAVNVPRPDMLAGELPAIAGYEVLERLGEGNMGTVYKARHLHMDRLVALKVIRKDRLTDPEALPRFQREIKVAAKLTHPNIVAVFDSGQSGDLHYMIMEFVQGEDLAHLVKRKGPLPVAEACDYIRQAAFGLQHAHQRGLIHRDIKPSNLLKAEDGGIVKILDMGLARAGMADQTEGSAELTIKGVMMGTPAYIAPEQAIDSRSADIRSDIYSLGCTLFHLLAGRPPFYLGSAAEILLKHHLEEPPAIRDLRADVPEELEAVLKKMMAKKPADRYQTPAEVAEALVPFVHSGPSMFPSAAYKALSRPDSAFNLPVPNTPASWPEITGSQPPAALPAPKRGRLAGAIVGVILAAGLLGGTLAMYLRPSSDTAQGSAPPPQTTPDSTTPMESPLATLKRAEELLNKEPTEAAAAFRRALSAPDIQDFREPSNQARLGLARALARTETPPWKEIEAELAQLTQPTPEQEAVRTTLRLLASRSLPPQEFLPLVTAWRAKSFPWPSDAIWEREEVLKAATAATANLVQQLPTWEKDKNWTALEQALAVLRAYDPAQPDLEQWERTLRKELGLPRLQQHVKQAQNALDKGDLAAAEQALGEAKKFLTDYPEKAPRVAALELVVRALQEHAAGKSVAAAELLARELFSKQPDLEDLRTGERRTRLAEVFAAAAQALRNSGADAWKQPYKTQADAQQAFSFASQAVKLGGSKLNRATLALAAWYKPQPDTNLARHLSHEVVTAQDFAGRPFTETYPVLLTYVKTRESTPALHAEAVRGYARLVELARRQGSEQLPPLQLYQELIVPAVQLAATVEKQQTDEETRKALASLYAAQAELISDNLAVRRRAFPTFQQARKQALASIETACRLDPQNARYLVRRARARFDLKQYDLAAARQDAERAIELAPDYPGGHSLLGYVLHLQHRFSATDPKSQVAILKQAEKAYAAAIELCDFKKKSPEELPDLLTWQSSLLVDLAANSLADVLPADVRRKNLEKAREVALRATQIPNRSHPDWAWTALGTACEELANVWQQDPAGNYSQAARAYQEACKFNDEAARSWIDLGRCKYLWYKYGQGDATLLGEAAKHLERALKEAERDSADRSDRDHALSWLAKVELAKGNLALQEALAAIEPKRTTALNEARAAAERILAKSPSDPTAALLLGQTYLQEGKHKEALVAFARGIPAKASQAERAHLDLMIARLDCFLRDNCPKELLPPALQQASSADELADLANRLKTDDLVRGKAFGVSGLLRHRLLLPGAEILTEPEQRGKAVEHLRKAVALAAKHPESWQWRVALAIQLRSLARDAKPAERDKYRKEALDNLEAAQNSPGAREYQKQIENLINQWEPN